MKSHSKTLPHRIKSRIIEKLSLERTVRFDCPLNILLGFLNLAQQRILTTNGE